MVARFRADSALLKGRCALVESKLLHPQWFWCQCIVSFFLGICATFLWFFWDFDTVAGDA